MGRKQFLKKGEDSRQFRLQARSQNDANADDPNVNALVLEPCLRPGEVRRTGLSPEELMTLPPSLEKAVGAEVFGRGERLDDGGNVNELLEGGAESGDDEDEDEHAYLEGDCYFPKDGYNYEQHLKRVKVKGAGGGVGGVVLERPKATADEIVVEKKIVPTVGAAFAQIDLQEAQTQEQIDVLRALDFADEYDELEDEELDGDFLPGGLAENDDQVVWGPTVVEYKGKPDLNAFKAAYKARLAETKEGDDDEDDEDGEDRGEILDDEDFAAFMAEEYGEEEIGDCEEIEIEGHMTLDACEEVCDEYVLAKNTEDKELQSLNEPIKGKWDNVPRAIDETRALVAKYYEGDPEEGYDPDDAITLPGEDDPDDESRNWDCETVLSTLSNLSNRPGKIGRIKLIGKPKPEKESLPTLNEEGETKENDSDEDSVGSVIELPDVITERKTKREGGETPEEKRERKASVKAMRQVCRKMKKESKDMYKTEALNMPGRSGNGDVRTGLKVKKL